MFTDNNPCKKKKIIYDNIRIKHIYVYSLCNITNMHLHLLLFFIYLFFRSICCWTLFWTLPQTILSKSNSNTQSCLSWKKPSSSDNQPLLSPINSKLGVIERASQHRQCTKCSLPPLSLAPSRARHPPVRTLAVRSTTKSLHGSLLCGHEIGWAF